MGCARWILQRGTLGVEDCTLSMNFWVCHGQDCSLVSFLSSVYEDIQGRLWVLSSKGMWRWRPGPPRLYPRPGLTGVRQALTENDDGVILIATGVGLSELI